MRAEPEKTPAWQYRAVGGNQRSHDVPTATERRFAAGLIAPPCFTGVARTKYRDGGVTLTIGLPAIDSVIMRRAQIYVDTQLAAGITDVVLDCSAVARDDVTDAGLGLVVKLANDLRRERASATLTLGSLSDDLLALATDRGLDRIEGLRISTAFPTTPHSLEAHA